MWETCVWSLAWEDPLEKGKVTHSSILAWRIPWNVEPMGSQKDEHNWATFIHIIGFSEEKREKGPKKICEEIIRENFPNMSKKTLTQGQEVQSPRQDKPKEEYKQISLMNTDTKNKILANWIQQYIKRITQLNRMEFTAGMQGFFSTGDQSAWFITSTNWRIKTICSGPSLVVQWIIRPLPMQETRVRSLIWEDSTCHGATKPMQLLRLHSRPLELQLLKPVGPRAWTLQQEKPPQ